MKINAMNMEQVITQREYCKETEATFEAIKNQLEQLLKMVKAIEPSITEVAETATDIAYGYYDKYTELEQMTYGGATASWTETREMKETYENAVQMDEFRNIATGYSEYCTELIEVLENEIDNHFYR